MQLSASKKGGGKGKDKKPAAAKKGPPKNDDNSKNLDTDKREYIYQMYKLSKQVSSGGKKILSNINLSFYPGAKIGVLGNNGSGKSTLMRIMAGVDQTFEGDAAPARWAKIGYLEQVTQTFYVPMDACMKSVSVSVSVSAPVSAPACVCMRACVVHVPLKFRTSCRSQSCLRTRLSWKTSKRQ
jgi:ABC-type glutathione transport system ATPase component